MISDKCRICLKIRKNLRSIYEKKDDTTYAYMMTSIANVKIRPEDEINDKLCYSCCKKLTEAYDFKVLIEDAEITLQEASNLKRISFRDINDIKIKIEIELDSKPLPPVQQLPAELFKDGSQSIAYNNTVIKKIEPVHTDKTSLSVNEFLNSIKTESDNDHDYHDYDIGVDEYGQDSGSDYSLENDLKSRKLKKKKARIGITKNKKNKTTGKPKSNSKNWTKYPSMKPIKPKFIDDLRLARTEATQRLSRKPRKKACTKLNVCPYCGKLSKSINSHILLHTAERKFKCDKCDKAFFSAPTLTEHKKKHNPNRTFKCDQCIAAFNCKGSLKSHMAVHRDEKKHVCDICSKAFKRKAILTRHMMIHNFGNKPIQCELCPMTFITKYNLRHHLRVHTGERPFKCEICSQPYSYKHDFNRHCFKKHGVFLKRRSVYVMNEEVLQQEKAIMRDLVLRAHGVIKGGVVENPFEGPQAALAFEQAMKAIESNKIPITY
ncbi:zinc finger protein 626-like [Trichoplusia ni]|uniref:Zinc finger protein 626-like n=1 Tax=Trichoplusia ni TaxID=7111 RepID=A0A7E5VM09_TRINI|nr:zinc finger protein 626-like [Trichoplusia ni]